MIPSNPFCTRFVRPGTILYQFADGDADRLNRLVGAIRSTPIGLIVGPHGTGKSTLVATLRPSLKALFSAVDSVTLVAPPADAPTTWWRRRRIRVGNWKTVLAAQTSLADRGLLILDGAEQISPRHWKRLRRLALRRGQTILATSHEVLPGSGVVYRSENSCELVWSLTRSLVSQRDGDLWTRIGRELSLRQVGPSTNVRDLWFDLYDVVQYDTAQPPGG